MSQSQLGRSKLKITIGSGVNRVEFSGEGAPLLHPMNWSVKRRYDTIFGRAGDNVCVTLRIIWQNFLRVIWHIGAQFLSDRSPGFQAPLSTSSFGCSLQPVNLNSTVNSDDCCRTALIWETQHTNCTKLGDFARYENVLHESVSPTPKESVDSIGDHAEAVGSARLAEENNGRASLLFLSPPNILHLNGRPRTRARSLLLKVCVRRTPCLLMQLV
jgi:hypothetical protein